MSGLTPFLESWLLSGAVFETRPGTLLLAARDLRISDAPDGQSCASSGKSENTDENAGKVSFFAPDFFLTNPKPWLNFSESRWFTRDFLAAALDAWIRSSPPVTTWKPRWSGDPAIREYRFRRELTELLERFEREELVKAVPVTFEDAPGHPGPADRARALLALLERAEGSRIYGFWTEGSDAEGLLGASPEVLFEVDAHGDLETMALAGTAPKSEGWSVLWNSEKDQREHRHVIDDIRERIGRFGHVSVGSTHVCELPTLFHLRTRIRLQTAACVPFEDWVEVMHPTAALGGYPREASARWLREHDRGTGRGRFGAPFGVKQADGSGVCLVGIRSVQWNAERTRLFSGCGVLKGSDADREWRELAHKRSSVKRMLGWELS